VTDNVTVTNRLLRPLNVARGILLVIVIVLLVGPDSESQARG
jgi:hypothetical protein